MALLPILIHPDPRLKKKTPLMEKPIEGLDTIIDNMIETMYDAPGIGLAAPQVGLIERLFVMDTSRNDEERNPVALINPEITWVSEELNEYEEGCLSIPEIYENVTRPASVRMKFLDRHFQPQEITYEGLEATCVQHELDHLNGKLFVDFLSSLKRQMITKKMQKLKKELKREA